MDRDLTSFNSIGGGHIVPRPQLVAQNCHKRRSETPKSDQFRKYNSGINVAGGSISMDTHSHRCPKPVQGMAEIMQLIHYLRN